MPKCFEIQRWKDHMATIAALKQVMREGLNLSVADGAALELKTFAHYNRTQPYGREGYTAFREKRQPSWKVE